MPPVKIPDVRVHEICSSCKQWFEPDDGEYISLRGSGPLSRIQRVGDMWTGVDRSRRFICQECKQKREAQRKKVISIIVVLWFAFFAAAVVGVIFYLPDILDGIAVGGP